MSTKRISAIIWSIFENDCLQTVIVTIIEDRFFSFSVFQISDLICIADLLFYNSRPIPWREVKFLFLPHLSPGCVNYFIFIAGDTIQNSTWWFSLGHWLGCFVIVAYAQIAA